MLANTTIKPNDTTQKAGRQQQKERTRNNILTAARQLFLQFGYEATTTRQIADVVGVAIGTVFAHFPDKHALLKELVQQDVDAVIEKAREDLNPETDWLTATLHYARWLYEYHHTHSNVSVSLLKEVVFDNAYCDSQLEAFNAALAGRMSADFPQIVASDRDLIARMTLESYFMVLIRGLDTLDSEPADWLEQLKLRCQLLVRPLTGDLP